VLRQLDGRKARLSQRELLQRGTFAGVPCARHVAIAKGFGLRGATITDVNQFPKLFEAYAAQDTAELWNIHVSDTVVSPSTRRGTVRGHGKM